MDEYYIDLQLLRVTKKLQVRLLIDTCNQPVVGIVYSVLLALIRCAVL
jgi:hypothetical protein